MLPGWPLAARSTYNHEPEELGQDIRFKRVAGLRAAQYRRDFRSNKSIIARARGTSGAGAPETGRFKNGEGTPDWKSVCRLEPERRTQDNGERLLAAGQGAADRFNAGRLGRSRDDAQKEKSEAIRLH